MRFAIVLAAMLLPFAANAQHSHADHHSHAAGHSEKAGEHDLRKCNHCPKMKSSQKLVKDPAVQAYIASAKKMHHGMDISYTGDADIDFARSMVPHHQGAVDMAEILLKFGKDEELRKLARRIIVAQRQEIGLMTRWIETHYNAKSPVITDSKTTPAYREAMAKMHKHMDIAYVGDVEMDFVNGMIPHHQGAIDMAEVLIKHGKAPLLLDIAQDVIRSQQQEIALMQNWLARHPISGRKQ